MALHYVMDSWANVDAALGAETLTFIGGATPEGSVTSESVASNITITGTLSAENDETICTAVDEVFSGIEGNAPTVALVPTMTSI